MKITKAQEKYYKYLESGSDTEVLQTIESLRVEGNEHSIPFLVKTLVTRNNEEIKNAVANLLFELKNENALPALIASILNPENKEYKSILISACWESGLNCSSYLSFFVDLAIQSDYLECIECLTVIENMPGPFDDALLIECAERAKNAADEDEGKFELLQSLWEVLVDFRGKEEDQFKMLN
jgi:hypothetical protein